MIKKIILLIILIFLFNKNIVISNNDIVKKPVAIVVKVRGETYIIRKKEKLKANIYMPLYIQDKIQTKSASTLELIFDNGVSFKIEENCDIEIKMITTTVMEGKKLSSVELEIDVDNGGLLVDAKTIDSEYKLTKMKVYTPTATAAIRGTVFYTLVKDDGRTDLAVFEGEVEGYVGKKEELDDLDIKTKIIKNQQTNITELTTVPPVVSLSSEMKEYRDTVVRKFVEEVQLYRKKIDTLKQKRQDWINKNKSDFEKDIEDKKKNFRKKYLNE